MNLDSLVIQLTPSGAWESMDEGTAFLRQNIILIYPQFFLFLLLVATPGLLLLHYNLFAALLYIWWIKPLYDRFLLYNLTQRLFNEPVSFKLTLRNASQWFFKTGLVSDLTLGRLNGIRSFSLPVKQLERLRSSDFQSRISVLKRTCAQPAFLLTVLALHLEMVVNIAINSFIFMLIPQETGWFSLLFDDQSLNYQIYSVLVYMLTIFVIEPLYVCSGLFLYLKRRIRLEAWDIELVFRKMNTHIEARPESSDK